MNLSALVKALASLRVPQLSVDASGNVQGIAGADGRTFQGIKGGVSSGLRLLPGNGSAITSTGAGTGVGKLIDVQHPALGDFYGVRLVYANYDTVAPMTINKAKVAAAPKHLTSAGNALAWSAQVTFGGSLTGTVPSATVGASSAAPQNVIPGMLVSDFVPVASIARNDGGSIRMLRVRSHVPDNVYPLNLSFLQFQNYNAAVMNNGLQYGCIAVNDSAANLETNVTSLNNNGGTFTPVGVIFYYTNPAKHIAAFGDSLMQGAGSATSQYMGWPARLTMDSAGAGRLVSASNYAVAGQKIEDSLAIARNYCALHKPDYAAFCAWSPNNPTTQAGMDALWGSTLYTIDFMLKLGITPVVLTSPPVNAYTQANKDLIAAQNARILSLPKNIITVDIAAALTLNGNINAAYDNGDGTHWNDAGEALAANLVYSAIK
jgi:lysophospholipase L1-like esterase